MIEISFDFLFRSREIRPPDPEPLIWKKIPLELYQMTDLEPAVNSTDALIYAGTDVDADSSDLVNLARAQRIADVWNEEKTKFDLRRCIFLCGFANKWINTAYYLMFEFGSQIEMTWNYKTIILKIEWNKCCLATNCSWTRMLSFDNELF
jgi:hypothetical protein